MNKNQIAVVVTTINGKTDSIKLLENRKDLSIIVVGDTTTPYIIDSNNLTYLSIEKQESLGFQFSIGCPYNHYSRKNLGFLYAAQNGADIIIDIDDDNFLLDLWDEVDFVCNLALCTEKKFVNIYKYFSDCHIWPRGYPLNRVLESNNMETIETSDKNLGVLQFMVSGAPDVDAIYRLTQSVGPINFNYKPKIYLQKGVYSPFNSQCSFWTKECFMYLYLPTSVKFRYTDILRGYVAQRIMWELDMYLGFCGPFVFQNRNEHNLLSDFESEMDIYTNMEKTVDVIDGSDGNMISIYENLIRNDLIDRKELKSLYKWLDDIKLLG